MKILLVQPPQTILKYKTKTCQPSLALGYIASVLRTAHDVEILDTLAEGFDNEDAVGDSIIRYGLSFEQIKEKIQENRPDIVGITCLFSTQFENALKTCSIVKEINPQIKTLVGGHHPSAMPNQVLENGDIDFVLRYEAEPVILKLIDAIEKDKNYREVPNLGFKDNGGIILNKLTANMEDLDNIPFPAWDLFPLELYFEINRAHGGTLKKPPFFPVLTSRGCPFDCVFCGSHVVAGKRYRARSVDNIIDELRLLKNKFGAREVFFEDDNLTLDKERANNLFKKMLQQKLNLSWSPPNGLFVQSIDEHSLQLMKKCGCHSVSFAVESADPTTQKEIIHKKVDLNKVDYLLSEARKVGLSTSVFFIVGFPGESYEQIQRTLRYARLVKCDSVNIFFATPLPGSEMLKKCEELNLIEDSTSFDIEDRLNFIHDMVPNNKIEKDVYNTRLVIKLKLLLRNPAMFLEKVAQKLRNDPQYFVKYLKKIVQKFLLR